MLDTQRKPFDVNTIEADVSALIPQRDQRATPTSLRRSFAQADSSPDESGSADGATLEPQPRPTDAGEVEHSAFFCLGRGSSDRTLITFLEVEGYPILRVSTNGASQDLILNNDQVKLLLRQMTLWLTR